MEWLYAVLILLALTLVLALCFRGLGDYMAYAYTTEKDWRIERGFYRLIGADPKSEQPWQSYLRALLIFSVVGLLIVYLLQRTQQWLPYSLGLPAVSQQLAFNTAASFTTNTNWQSYSPEQTLGYTVQLAGLAIQNFMSAAVGMAVAISLVRAFAGRKQTASDHPGIGNFWVDVTRSTTRILVPIAVIGAIVLMAGGVIQNFNGFTHVTTLAGNAQQIPGGPTASQEVIKLLGTNGGGFFNANSAHPYENPTAWTNLFEIVLMLCIPFALPRTFGRIVGDNRQGYAILAAMGTIFVASFLILTALQLGGHGSAPQAAGGAMEGIEQRIGIVGSSLFSTTSTGTSTGAVSAMHDSYTALGGMITMLNMMLGEVTPGGVGTGLYGMLVDAVIAVFVAGLLVGRTPEYLGKKIGPREIKLASLYMLVTPSLVLAGTAMSFGTPGVKTTVANTSVFNPGVHGMSEVLYAFTSGANNNGSAFAGLTANTLWMNTALGVVMILGRFVPIVLVLALAGSLAAQNKAPENAGTLPTHRPMFIGLLIGVVLIVTALTYFPVLTLGPLAEGL